MKRIKLVLLFLFPVLFASLMAWATTQHSMDVKDPEVQQINVKCVNCHLKENNSLVEQWENSPHAAAQDGQVGCYNCHAAESGDQYGFDHEGAYIRTVLTPNDCSYCHEKEFEEMKTSHHATAGEIMASLDNALAEVIASFPETKADAVNGCWQCHGSIVSYQKDEEGNLLKNAQGSPKPDPMTWPNTGIGRINVDGSKGTCNACHSKHSFKASVARQPKNCGKCHMGPDHPQLEVYEESKHGIAFEAAMKGDVQNGMNILKDGDWILGKDYYFAPTCSSCHMGAYVKSNGSIQPSSHNPGNRISWTLRPKVSTKINRVVFTDGSESDVPGDIPPRPGQKVRDKTYVREGNSLKGVIQEKQIKKVTSWKQRRKEMQGACKQCHSLSQIEGFYMQYDSLVVTYNDKFAKPALNLVKELKADDIWEGTGFQTHLGYTWFELWHHEGRRARHGAAMLGPDYTHWHGMYEVSRNFYHEFLPEVQELAEEAGQGEKYEKLIDEILDRPEHQWYHTGGGEALMRKIQEEQELRYGTD